MTGSFQEEVLPIQALKPGMNIVDYLDFTDRYKPMNQETCNWVIHNFRGAKAQVFRDEKDVQTPIERIQEGDYLCKIFDFPKQLGKLTKVSAPLVAELGKRGFTKFRVQKPAKVASAKQLEVEKAVEKVNVMVEQASKGIKVKEAASTAIESLLDNARMNKINQAEIKSYADQIVGESNSEAMSAIVSLKQSDQTYAHCVDVGVIFQTVYFNLVAKKGIKSPFSDKHESLMGAFMHDFGKSKVPKEILDSTTRFERDSQEMRLMQSHPEKGAMLLNKMGLPDYIVNMSHYHHVKLDTSMKSSYPREVDYNHVLYETRLLAIVDVYQALVGRRSYKKSWAPPDAVKYIDTLAGVEFDLDVWEDFKRTNGLYPVNSLVELSNGSIGFVMNVPEEDLERPQVVEVKNASGDMMASNQLIDLKFEKDISITQSLDSFEVFGDDALNVFLNLKVVS